MDRCWGPARFKSSPVLAVMALAAAFLLNLHALSAQESKAKGKAPAAKEAKTAPPKKIETPAEPEDMGAPETPKTEPCAAPEPEAGPGPLAPAPTGISLSIGWLIILFLSCLSWVLLADWLNRDAHALEMRRHWWNLLMIGAGMGGIALFWFGHAIFTFAPFLFGVLVCVTYIPVRNKYAKASGRIWTREHIRLKLIAALRKVGIQVNTRTFLRGKVAGEELRLLRRDGQPISLPEVEGGRARAEEGISCLKEILDGALKRRATCIQLQPRGELLRVRYCIDGIFYDRGSYSWELVTPIMASTKGIAGIDTSERGRAHVGGFAVALADRTVGVRASVEYSVQGETILLALMDPTRAVFRLDKIGLPDEIREPLRDLLKGKNGLILVCGPPGSGATTTLYAMIAEIDPEKRKVVTIEQPIEYRLKGLSQHAVDAAQGRPFPKVLQAAVGERPDVLVIGDVDSKESARAALREANEGKLVLGAMYADSAVEGLKKLFQFGADPNVISGALRGILAQRLVRRMCKACRQAFKPSEELLKKIGVTPESAAKLYKAVGCVKCMKTGFIGRTGIFELLDVSDKMRAMMASETPAQEVLEQAERDGHGHIWDDGITKVLDGATSIQELIRVTKSK
ncbi:MAG: Flp pilus assembly complex ATPase component [Planctomycetes bacterium]|nr:Flp pilus assembly complex ATPase component [Planctomycetota bacterium]